MAPEGGGSSNGISDGSPTSKQAQKLEPAGAAPPSSMEYQLKKYLLLLATLVATVTYAAGLNPPGGSWLEDDASGQRLAGDSILRDTNYMRYLVFYCFNAISFAASLVVSLLLLLLHSGEGSLLKLTRAVMVIDLLALMGAYAAGGSHDAFTTVCASVLVAAASAYVILVVPNLSTAARNKNMAATPPPSDPAKDKEELEKHEILLLLAIFVATVAYVAGLNPPGGFWRSTQEQQQGGHRHAAGNPVLQGLHPVRYKFFFFSNTAAFITSLLAITITVHYEKLNIINPPITLIKVALYGLVVTAILGLGGAYAAGSCRDSKHTTYVLSLVAPVLVCILLQRVLVKSRGFKLPCFGTSSTPDTTRNNDLDKDKDKIREFIQLLAILAATVAYQAGLDPPGGVWAEGEAPGGGHRVGDPILLTTHPVRYKVFFYFNSGALVASLVIMVILQNEFLVQRHALEAAMILDLFGLMGAYAAGSCRDTSTSIYTVALAGGVLVYVVIHIVFFTLDPARGGNKQTAGSEEEAAARRERDDRTERKREVLLLLAILAATLTYQAGLTPPGGFWEKDEHGHSAGSPVLQDMYPRRYKAFFYCNAASFMASVALIVLLLNPNLYRPGIRCYALFVCMVAGMFGLIGAYAAGSSLHLRTSIIVLVLVTAVFTAVVYVAYIRRQPSTNDKDAPKDKNPDNSRRPVDHKEEEHGRQQPGKETDMMAKYLMLVGILAASVTYLTGLKPPGGMWRDDGGGHDAGNPVLYDIQKHRYNAFFYSNSTSFMASVTVIALLLSRMIRDSKDAKPLWPMHTAMLMDMLALLGAYAAGSARDWGTSKNVVLLLFPVLGFVALLFFWKKGKGDDDAAAAGGKAIKVGAKTDNQNGGTGTSTTQQNTP